MEYLGTQNQDKSYATKDFIAESLKGYYKDTQVDELHESAISEANKNKPRVYLNPTRVNISSSSETNESTTSTSGTLCYNVSTGHILYKVDTTYYNGSFYHDGYIRASQAGDVVLFTSDTYTGTNLYIHNGTNFVLLAMADGGVVTTRLENYRGIWSESTAASETEYYKSAEGSYDTVTWNKCLWQCVASGTTDEPSDSTGSWINMSGGVEVPTLSVWKILPNTDIVNIRYDAEGNVNIEPKSVTCNVLITDTEIGTKTYTSMMDLQTDYGIKLYYSIDGATWKEFIIGNAEPLETEESEAFELEESTAEEPKFITLGGDDVNSSDIGDRIYFELRNDTDVLARSVIPVVKDGKDCPILKNGKIVTMDSQEATVERLEADGSVLAIKNTIGNDKIIYLPEVQNVKQILGNNSDHIVWRTKFTVLPTSYRVSIKVLDTSDSPGMYNDTSVVSSFTASPGKFYEAWLICDGTNKFWQIREI